MCGSTAVYHMLNDLPTAPARSNRRAFGSRLSSILELERERWMLWLPVALAIGIGVYFSLPDEPPIWIGVIPLALLFGLAFMLRWKYAEILILGLALCSGFVVAQFRTISVESPQLSRRLGPVSITGRVVQVEPRKHGVRVTLAKLSVERLSRQATPDCIRLRAFRGLDILVPGHFVTFRAVLLPLRPPVTPGAYDFQRHAYFQRIGATGFAVSTPEAVNVVSVKGGFWDWLASLRRSLTNPIVSAIG
jgi:competence protein ComEC